MCACRRGKPTRRSDICADQRVLSRKAASLTPRGCCRCLVQLGKARTTSWPVCRVLGACPKPSRSSVWTAMKQLLHALHAGTPAQPGRIGMPEQMRTEADAGAAAQPPHQGHRQPGSSAAGRAGPRSGGAPLPSPSPAAPRPPLRPHPLGARASRRAAAHASDGSPSTTIDADARSLSRPHPAPRVPGHDPTAAARRRSPGNATHRRKGAGRPRPGRYLPINTGCLQAPSDGPPIRPRMSGAPLRFYDVVTLSSPTKKGNPAGLPSTSSSPSMTPNHLHVVSHGVVQQQPAATGASRRNRRRPQR
jgi:hypothetical protein